jgi:hypothetical protein
LFALLFSHVNIFYYFNLTIILANHTNFFFRGCFLTTF